MRKIINSETRKYEENVTDTLVLDATPTVNSFNSVTSDGVARAIAGGGNVPAPSEGDDGKVLTVVDGAAAWAEAQGGSSYTAGDGIAIENDEIKVRVKDDRVNPLKVSLPEPVGTDADLSTPDGSPEAEGWKAMSNGLIRYEYNDKHDETDFVFRYLWNRNDPNPLGMVNSWGDDSLHFDAKIHLLWISGKESYTDLVATSDTLSDAFTVGRYAWDKMGSQAVYSLGTLVDTTEDGYVFEVRFTVPGEYTDDANYIAVSASGSDFSGINETVASVFLNESHVLTLQGDSVYVIGETIPGGDLYVDVDQTYNEYSSKPQSGVAVAQALANVPQVPEATSADQGKALVYGWNGSKFAPKWGNQTSSSIKRGPGSESLEVRLREDAGHHDTSGIGVNTSEIPTSITGTVKTGGANASYYAAFTKDMALSTDDSISVTGFEDCIPSAFENQAALAVVVAGDTWQSGTLVGGPVMGDNDMGLNLAYPEPTLANIPDKDGALTNFFEDYNTFMVFAVSSEYLTLGIDPRIRMESPFWTKWVNDGLYAALEQYAIPMTQPSGDVEFEIPSRPVETRGIYVKNPLPAYTSADAGKVLAVNSGATGTEWVAPAAPSGGSDEWWGGGPGDGLGLARGIARLRFKDTTYDPRNDSDPTFIAKFNSITKVSDGVYDFACKSNQPGMFLNKYLVGNECIIVGLSINFNTCSEMFRGCTGLRAVYNLESSTNPSCEHMFDGCTNLMEVRCGVSQGDNVFRAGSSCEYMFCECTRLRSIDMYLPESNTTNRNLSSICSDCKELEVGPSFGANVSSCVTAFHSCVKLQRFAHSFSYNGSTYVHRNNVDCSYMFGRCNSLQSLAGIYPFFLGTTISNASYMFESCIDLQEVPYIKLEVGASCSDMFNKCASLKNVPGMDWGNIANMANMFKNCSTLVSLNDKATGTQWYSGTLNASLADVSNMFANCFGIKEGLGACYTGLSSHSGIATYSGCFTSCGVAYSNPDLANIPSSWGGTGA